MEFFLATQKLRSVTLNACCILIFFNKTIDAVFEDRSCIGVFEGGDTDFISITTIEGQELISKHSIKELCPSMNNDRT